MRFKGTLALLILCAAFGSYLYLYEIKGGEKREKSQQEEKQVWKIESKSIEQMNLVFPDSRATAVRTSEKEWKITVLRELDADSDELDRLAGSAADISRESVLEPNAADLSKFGLNPAEVSLQLKTKDGKGVLIHFTPEDHKRLNVASWKPGQKIEVLGADSSNPNMPWLVNCLPSRASGYATRVSP